MPRSLFVLCLGVLVAWVPVASSQSTSEDRATRAIRRELLLLPRYGVFDHLAFKYDRGTVTLLGQVRIGQLKSDAEAAAKSVEGVDTIVNNIEILPTSPQDDRIRLDTYRAIYRHDALERYAILAMPPIHIIVKNGHVILEGIVNSRLDKTLAATQARTVSGVFSVTDNLRVENP
jgi:hyperosmotically inducible protein